MTPNQELQRQEARRRFAEAAQQDETRLDLARAALLIAAEEEPGLHIEPYLSRIRELAQEAELVLDTLGGSRIAAFNDYFFDTLGFTGNRRNYQDPRNSFLNRVLERRTGIPITLSVLYLEIGRRVGLEVEGVGLPGHFIVSVSESWHDEPTLVDPFYSGLLTRADCQARLDDIFSGQLRLHPLHLRAVSKKEILARMLANLKNIYAQAKLYPRALAASERILLLDPDAHHETRDCAIFLAALGRWDEAVKRAESYLQAAPAAPDFTETRALVKQWQRRRATLN